MQQTRHLGNTESFCFGNHAASAEYASKPSQRVQNTKRDASHPGIELCCVVVYAARNYAHLCLWHTGHCERVLLRPVMVR